MNRYRSCFSRLSEQNRCAFIPFAVAGDPDMQRSYEIFKTYIEAGADILEIGLPFSDPIADGPVNQKAANRAIAAGFTLEAFFELIKSLRALSATIPFGILAYANSLYRIGFDTFCKRAAEAGIDSILVADLPPEEAAELGKCLKTYGLQSVFIVSELTPPQRIKKIAKLTTGFFYIVSRLGVTGTANELGTQVAGTIAAVRSFSDIAVCVGFGISSPEHIRQLKPTGTNGVIVGSALVKTIDQHQNDTGQMLKTLQDHITAFKAAC